jgi:hypothetical protein
MQTDRNYEGSTSGGTVPLKNVQTSFLLGNITNGKTAQVEWFDSATGAQRFF